MTSSHDPTQTRPVARRHRGGVRALLHHRATRLMLSVLLLIVAASVLIGVGCQQSQSSKPYYTTARDSSMDAGAERSGAFKTRKMTAGLPRPSTGEEAGPADRAVGRSFASVTDEVWIIAAPPRDADPAPRRVAQTDDDFPGSGTMLALIPGDDRAGELRERRDTQPTRVPMPLQHTDVRARIDGFIASVDVTQKFANPFNTKIEAVYVFPLPEQAAVSGFVMRIGDRTIRGLIREREEAEQIYADARAQGYNAALMTQERPNIFTQRVANIEPGKGIDVELTYFETLGYSDGMYQFVFPMVVGPRYHAATGDAAARAVGHTTGENTNAAALNSNSEGRPSPEGPKYLRPDQRSGHDISLRVEMNPAIEVAALRSVQHEIARTTGENGGTVVSIAEGDTLPNRDFVLQYQVGGERVQSDLLMTGSQGVEGEPGGYFTLMLHPPVAATSLDPQPMELVFVIDASGSMSGEPIAQVKSAVAAALSRMGEGDAFQIVAFNSSARAMSSSPLIASEANLRRGIEFVNAMDAGGGTQMIKGVEAALNERIRDGDRYRVVTFFTDGFISNEAEILAALHDNAGDTRVFSVGVGSSVNRYLIQRMARMGRGAATVLSNREDAEAVMSLYMQRVRRPAMTDVSIDWGGLQVSDVYPKVLPDLFVGRPIVVTGRYRGTAFGDSGPVMVRGRTGASGEPLEIALVPRGVDVPALEKVWARLKITDLHEAQFATRDPDGELAGEIERTALRHGLMSAYTAFLAVDASGRTPGSRGVSVEQGVPVPEGVEYETTVGP